MMKLLIVDDDQMNCDLLQNVFTRQGYHVITATSGREGLRQFRASNPRVTLLDLRMPEMDGATFLKAVRARWPGIVRILLTGYADIGSTITAINRGEIHRYIAKPWDEHELLGATHVTFAVCSANGRVLAAIDLDTERGSSRRTLQIKQSVLGVREATLAACGAVSEAEGVLGRRWRWAARSSSASTRSTGPAPTRCACTRRSSTS